MKLITGTDSTWSLRVWICSQIAQLTLDIHVVDLTDANYKSEILKHSSTGLVPALYNGELVVHDSLAITEYFNECANGVLYPQAQAKRALARSLCAEMHSGFMALRTSCPFTLDVVEPLGEVNDDISKELVRIEAIFKEATLPFMFERPSAVDAFYAILAVRLNTYGITFQGRAGMYQQHLLEWPTLIQALELAKSWHTNP